MTICEHAELKGLAVQVCQQAVRDLVNKKAPLEKRIDALLWLCSPELEIWSDWAGWEIPPSPYKLLVSDWDKIRKKLKTRSI